MAARDVTGSRCIPQWPGSNCICYQAHSTWELNRGPHPPPLKNTNQFSGWYFFACRRVFTGVDAESCGLRICTPTAIPHTFRSLQAAFLSALPTSLGSKSASTKFIFLFVQWVTRGLADAVFSQHWVAMETLRGLRQCLSTEWLNYCD